MPSPLTPASFESRRDPRAPMLWAFAALASGIAIGIHAWRPAAWLTATTVAFTLFAFYLVRNRIWMPRALALAALLFLGALNIQLRPPDAPDLAILAVRHRRRTADHRAYHSSCKRSKHPPNPRRRNRNAHRRRRHPAAPRQPALESVPKAVSGNPRTLLRNSNPISPPNFIRRTISAIPAPSTTRDIFTRKASPRSLRLTPALLKFFRDFIGTRVESLRTRIHASVIHHVHGLWPPPQAALIDAMVIGEDAFIDRDTRIDFQRSGTYHILVVSGMNLGILVVVVFWLLRRTSLREPAISIIAMLVAITYAFLTDAEHPSGAPPSCLLSTSPRDFFIASAACSTRSASPLSDSSCSILALSSTQASNSPFSPS